MGIVLAVVFQLHQDITEKINLNNELQREYTAKAVGQVQTGTLQIDKLKEEMTERFEHNNDLQRDYLNFALKPINIQINNLQRETEKLNVKIRDIHNHLLGK